jgi:hypothetical protein
LVAKASALAEREFQMNWGIRGFALAAGAAALLSTQAVYAAPPAPRAVGVDPLVSLSVLGTTQSRVSLLAATAAVQDAPAMQTCPDGSVIPATAVCAPPPPGKGIGPLPLILGLIVFIGLMAAIVSGGGDADGDLTPVSPA